MICPEGDFSSEWSPLSGIRRYCEGITATLDYLSPQRIKSSLQSRLPPPVGVMPHWSPYAERDSSLRFRGKMIDARTAIRVYMMQHYVTSTVGSSARMPVAALFRLSRHIYGQKASLVIFVSQARAARVEALLFAMPSNVVALFRPADFRIAITV